MKITFPDGSSKDFKEGTTGLDIAKEISEGLARAALAIKVNDELIDLSRPIEKDAKIRIITFKDDEGKEIFRHSSSHILATAVKKLYPKAKLGIGPAVEEGFYYDFDMPPLKPEDLKKIEEEMNKIVKEKQEFTRQELSKKEVLTIFKDEPFKKELIKELKDEKITVYTNGKFKDFCRGPHVPNTGYIKAFKLMRVAGAYWKGDSANKQLQRIYGVSFPDKKDLKDYLTLLEEAEKRNHVKIGKEMDLFSIHPEGPGFPFFHHKGLILWNMLINFWREKHQKAGYIEQKTPIILNRSLWETSGHWEYYLENMYTLKIDKQDYAVKPMNCPGGMLLYKEKVHSYKELPIRAGEIGLVHRHELSGVLNGLFRVRAFHQDDAHIFCLPEQMGDEISGVIDLVIDMYGALGFKEYSFEISTKPDKAVGTDEMWEKATATLKNVLEKRKIKYGIDEGAGVFYGPKIDIKIKDSIGREWQCATIQYDFNLPERFDVTYEGEDGKKHRPLMIHRVIYGSLERFMGVLIEHYAGKFPLWLNPVQVKVLTIADRHKEYCCKVVDQLKEAGIRVELDDRVETMNKKIREAELAHVNYILVVGDKELESKTVNVRTRDNKVVGAVDVDKFIKQVLDEVEKKL